MSAKKIEDRFNSTHLYNRFRVTMKVRDRIYGGTPKNKDVIATWVVATTGYQDELTEVQTKEALETMTESVAEKMWTGFPRDETGWFIWDRQIKAAFKEAGVLLGIFKKKRGSKQIIQHGSFLIRGVDHERRIYPEMINLPEPLDVEEGPIHVQTPKGPRTALKRQDYMAAPTFKFEIWVLKTQPAETRHIGEKEIVHMLTFAQENGLGASRSQGNGKFDVIEFEEISK